jgi:uncharacterized protein (TIGR03118 family)
MLIVLVALYHMGQNINVPQTPLPSPPAPPYKDISPTTVVSSKKYSRPVLLFFSIIYILLAGLIGFFIGMKDIRSQQVIKPLLMGIPQASVQFRVKEIDLVSSVQGYTAITDSKLTDAWGLEFGDPGRVWINGNSGFSVAYNGQGQYIQTKVEAGGLPVPLAVQVPLQPGATSPDGDDDDGSTGGAPVTGMIFSKVRAFSGDAFTFVTEQGIIAGWHPNPDGTSPLQAQLRVNSLGAVYKGVTSAKTNQGWLLYVANFGQDRIDIFDNTYEPLLLNGFTDPSIPKGYAPFNIKTINNQLYVTYAKQALDDKNDVHGLGNGYVDIYTTSGTLVKRLISGGVLDSPWGMALAPSNFGNLSNYLLVGNFGDGYINVFDPTTGKYIGTVDDEQRNPLQIDGLWSLTFGTNNGAGKSNELFFSAGPSAESQGLFGKLQPLSQN